jgi:hypothetical protein
MADRRVDPVEYHEIWQAKLETAIQAYLNDEFPMTDAVFKATLFGLGYRNQEIEAEYNYYFGLKQIKRDGKNVQPSY